MTKQQFSNNRLMRYVQYVSKMLRIIYEFIVDQLIVRDEEEPPRINMN